jgi:hypothetical protein
MFESQIVYNLHITLINAITDLLTLYRFIQIYIDLYTLQTLQTTQTFLECLLCNNKCLI